jgi:hypothetical protein
MRTLNNFEQKTSLPLENVLQKKFLTTENFFAPSNLIFVTDVSLPIS